MLVDDAPFNLIPLEGILEMKSILCSKFHDGYTAISCFQLRLKLTCCKRNFLMVLTDIQMPEMDGYKLGELIIATEKYFFGQLKLRSVESWTKAKRHCPVIAVTAHCDKTVVEKALGIGIKKVLAKPVDE